MKKLFILLFTLFYFAAASGASVNMHFCMDELVNVNLWARSSDACDKCGTEKKADKNCCETKQEKIHVDKNQKLSQFSYKIPELSAIQTCFSLPDFQRVVLNEISLTLPPGKAPPKNYEVPAYLLLCTFRI
jgi:hypothetical protein